MWKLEERIKNCDYLLAKGLCAETLASADHDDDPSWRNPVYGRTQSDADMVELFGSDRLCARALHE